jgi:hypothetical protein
MVSPLHSEADASDVRRRLREPSMVGYGAKNGAKLRCEVAVMVGEAEAYRTRKIF